MARRFSWGRRYTLQSTDKDPALQCFLLRLHNDGGTLKHSVIAVQSNIGAVPAFAWKIVGASNTEAATPLLDSTTGFVNGAGVVAAFPSFVMFDTVDQVDEEILRVASMVFNNSGTAGINVRTDNFSANVNGVTRKRLALIFSMDGTGADVPIDTTTIAAGKQLVVRVLAALY